MARILPEAARRGTGGYFGISTVCDAPRVPYDGARTASEFPTRPETRRETTGAGGSAVGMTMLADCGDWFATARTPAFV
jgi:hypothetical protein